MEDRRKISDIPLPSGAEITEKTPIRNVDIKEKTPIRKVDIKERTQVRNVKRSERTQVRSVEIRQCSRDKFMS